MNDKVLVPSKNGKLLYQHQFESLIKQLTDIFQLSMDDSEKLKHNKIARIVGKLPYMAKCKNPERIALSHLAITYMASQGSGKDVFLHNPTDNESLLSRLERISHFDGGDENVIKLGMNLLALIMINDHRIDSERDRKIGKYNPLNSGIWDWEKLQNKLICEINELTERGIDSIYTVEELINEFWEIP